MTTTKKPGVDGDFAYPAVNYSLLYAQPEKSGVQLRQRTGRYPVLPMAQSLPRRRLFSHASFVFSAVLLSWQDNSTGGDVPHADSRFCQPVGQLARIEASNAGSRRFETISCRLWKGINGAQLNLAPVLLNCLDCAVARKWNSLGSDARGHQHDHEMHELVR